MTDKKLCFVVGPIGSPGEPINDHANFLLEYIIKPVMEEFPEYRVMRQDENTNPGMIDTQIITALRDADLVIADLSHLNANAFYEIGIRHMVSKPIIHMQLADQRIPFDLSLYKTVKFSLLNPSTIQAARTALEAQVTEAIAEGHQPDNPVTRALGQQHLTQTASPELKVVSDSLQSLTTRIATLEHGGTPHSAPQSPSAYRMYVTVSDTALMEDVQGKLKNRARALELVADSANRRVALTYSYPPSKTEKDRISKIPGVSKLSDVEVVPLI
jgi:hypothetical protein